MNDFSSKRKRIEVRKNQMLSQRRQAIDMYEEGVRIASIARTLAVDRSTVRYWILKYQAEGMEGLQPYARNRK